MNFYDDQTTTTRQLFDRFFPGRDDVVRLLMEPITYANGSTLEDPAITYGIVFSNFMSKGVFIYEGGTDDLIARMKKELTSNGVDIRINCPVDQIEVADSPLQGSRVSAVHVRGRRIPCRAVVSNANLRTTILKMIGEEKLDRGFVEQTEQVRLNNSSTQVYMALKPGEEIDESSGDLFFTSTAKEFRTDLLLSRDITSRTFSFYYPRTRPHKKERYAIVSSTNANWSDWADLSDEEYQASKDEPGRDNDRRTREVHSRRPRQDRSSRSRHAENVQTLHDARRRRELWHQVRRSRRQSGVVAASRRDVPCRQRWDHHERMARCDQLRRDRQQRSRPNARPRIIRRLSGFRSRSRQGFGGALVGGSLNSWRIQLQQRSRSRQEFGSTPTPEACLNPGPV